MADLGYRAIDTDSDDWCEWVQIESGDPDWVWREDRIARLLDQDDPRSLFVSGCKTNQGKFHHRFDHIVLLTAPTAVILDRLATRTTNDYGKSAEERARIVRHIELVEPLLRSAADVEIDSAIMSPGAVADRLVSLVSEVSR